MKFFKVTQYALTNKGRAYLENNPDAEWGCEKVTQEIVDSFYRDYYDESVEGVKRGRRIHNGVLDSEGDFVDFETWKQETLKYELNVGHILNPEFYFETPRGYIETSEVFNKDLKTESIHYITEGYYYRRFLLKRCVMAMENYPLYDEDEFYVLSDDKTKFEQTDAWVGFDKSGWVSCFQLRFEDYVKQKMG